MFKLKQFNSFWRRKPYEKKKKSLQFCLNYTESVPALVQFKIMKKSEAMHSQKSLSNLHIIH